MSILSSGRRPVIFWMPWDLDVGTIPGPLDGPDQLGGLGTHGRLEGHRSPRLLVVDVHSDDPFDFGEFFRDGRRTSFAVHPLYLDSNGFLASDDRTGLLAPEKDPDPIRKQSHDRHEKRGHPEHRSLTTSGSNR